MTQRLRRTVRLAGCVAALGVSLGCGEHSAAPGARDRVASGPASGDVLAVVDGIQVRADDLRSLAAAGPLTPTEALARLEAEALLMAEAERRGYGARVAVQRVARQALVQAYVEEQASAVTVAPSEVAAAYQREIKRYQLGEVRGFQHGLAPLPRDRPPSVEEEAAARGLIEELVAALSTPGAATDQVFEEFRLRKLPFRPLKVERVPPMSPTDLVKPFAAALFSAPAPGPLPMPVRTIYGWHAIVLTEIVPARQVPLEQAAPELEAELLEKARAEALTRHLAELRAAQHPALAPEHRQRLAEPRFDE
jgi:hypothetical protein